MGVTLNFENSNRPTWLIVFALSLGPVVSVGFARFAYGLLLPSMHLDLSWTYVEAGWIGTANLLGYVAGAAFMFLGTGQRSEKRAFLWGMFVTSIALALSGITRDFVLLTILRFLAGFAGALVFISGGALVATLFRRNARKSALAVGLYFAGGGIGIVICGSFIPWLVGISGIVGWQAAWILLGAVGFASVPLAYWALTFVDSPRSANSDLQLPDKLYWNTFLPILTAYFLFSFGYIVYMTFFVAWLVETGASPLLVSVVWVTLGLAVICAPFVWRRILSVTVGGRAFAACCVCMATGTLAPLLSTNVAGALISPFAFGLGLFIAPTALTVFVRKNFHEYQWSRALALSTIVFGVGQAVGPMAVGLLTDLLGKIELGLLWAGLALLLGAGFAFRQDGLKPLPMVDPG